MGFVSLLACLLFAVASLCLSCTLSPGFCFFVPSSIFLTLADYLIREGNAVKGVEHGNTPGRQKIAEELQRSENLDHAKTIPQCSDVIDSQVD